MTRSITLIFCAEKSHSILHSAGAEREGEEGDYVGGGGGGVQLE